MVKCNKDQVTRLQRALKREKNPTMRQRIQMVLLRENGMTQPEIAGAMGVSLSTVNRAHMAYDHGGRKALEPKPSGGRIRENMTLAEEKVVLDRFAKAAGAGEMLNIHDLKAAYEKAIGHPTRISRRRLTLKKRLFGSGKESPANRRTTWSSFADHVRR